MVPHYCANETVNGVDFATHPMLAGHYFLGTFSSNFMSKRIDVRKHACIHAGLRKCRTIGDGSVIHGALPWMQMSPSSIRRVSVGRLRTGGNLWSLNTDGSDVSNLLYICLISLAVRAMRYLFVLPVQLCGAFVSKPEGYVDTTNGRNLSDRLSVNVFVDWTTCKFCVPDVGSCSALVVATGNLSPLNEQQLVDCDSNVWPVKVISWTTALFSLRRAPCARRRGCLCSPSTGLCIGCCRQPTAGYKSLVPFSRAATEDECCSLQGVLLFGRRKAQRSLVPVLRLWRMHKQSSIFGEYFRHARCGKRHRQKRHHSDDFVFWGCPYILVSGNELEVVSNGDRVTPARRCLSGRSKGAHGSRDVVSKGGCRRALLSVCVTVLRAEFRLLFAPLVKSVSTEFAAKSTSKFPSESCCKHALVAKTQASSQLKVFQTCDYGDSTCRFRLKCAPNMRLRGVLV